MKVYVVWDQYGEAIVAIMSSEEGAEALCDVRNERYMAKLARPGYQDMGYRYSWETWEVDRETEASA